MRSLTEIRRDRLEFLFEELDRDTFELINNPSAEEIFIFNEFSKDPDHPDHVNGEWITQPRWFVVEYVGMTLEKIAELKKELIEEGSYSEDGSKLLTEDVEECGYANVKVHQDAIHEIFKKVDSLKSSPEIYA